jgi:pimeloyl-ACP methyl ester carboxylesterase
MTTTVDPDATAAPPTLSLRWWPLGLVTVVSMVLAIAGALPRWPGLAHVVALPPLDLLADVRVLVASAPSPLVFAVGLVLVVGVRAAILATMLGSLRRYVGFTCRFYLTAVVPALLAAVLDFSGRSVLYGYLMWAGLFITLATAVVLAPVPWTGAERVRRGLVTARHQRLRVGIIFAYLVALMVLGLLVREPGRTAQVVIVPASALFTALAIGRLARASMRRVSSLVAVGVALSVLVALVTVVLVVPGGGAPSKTPRAVGSLFLVAGADTASGEGALFHLDPTKLGFSCAQTFYFSYAGSGNGAGRRDAHCPIRRGAPYTKADTLRPLDQLRATFLAQLASVPRPVVVVTHSQGAWIAWAGLSRHDTRAAGVDGLVMLAPFDAALAPYPRSGHDGRGAVGGESARLVTDLGKTIGFSSFSADAPLVRELQATPGAVERLFGQRLDRPVRALALVSRFDLPLVPSGWPPGVVEACPGWVTHGSQPKSQTVLTVANRFLEAAGPGKCPSWVLEIAHVTDAFGAPPPGS